MDPSDTFSKPVRGRVTYRSSGTKLKKVIKCLKALQSTRLEKFKQACTAIFYYLLSFSYTPVVLTYILVRLSVSQQILVAAAAENFFGKLALAGMFINSVSVLAEPFRKFFQRL